MAAGILPQELRGPVLTEREGCTLALFPLDGLMDSLIPRCPVPDLIVYLRRRAQLEFGVTSWFGDLAQLGEKTHETGLRPWMNSLLENLTENEHWLRTLFPTQALQRYQERRVVYLPSWFPPSLSECALPPGAVAQFSKIQTVPPAGWEAFLARYSEANRLHKAVLRVSREVQGMRIHLRKTGLDDQNRQSLERVTEALARAGSADGLWHSPGRWAGVYDPAIRQAAWGALLEAEKTCNQVLGTHQGVRCERGDHNGDGREEVLVHTPHCLAMVEPEAGGVLSEFSIWRQPVNVLNAITRRQELYHDRLVRDSLLPALVEKGLEGMKADTGLGMSPEDEEETASIMVVDDDEYESGRWDLGDPRWEATLGDRLQHDRGTRASFMDHFLGSETTLENLWRGQHSEEGDFVYGSYNVLKAETVGPDLVDVHMAREGLVRQVGAKGVEDRLVQVNKQYRFHGTQSRVDVRYEISNRYHSPVHSTFGVEVNLGLDGRVGDLIALELEDGRSVPVTKRGKVDGIQKVVLVDQTRGLRIVLLTRRMATLWFYPVECFVAGSGGLETVYQGQCLLFGWPVSLWGEERVRLDLALEVQI